MEETDNTSQPSKIAFLKSRGYRQHAGDSAFWIKADEINGRYFKLADAYERERELERIERESEPQPPDIAAAAGYPFAEDMSERRTTPLEMAFARWLRAFRSTEAAKTELGAASDTLSAYRVAVGCRRVTVEAEGRLYILRFSEDNAVVFEEPLTAEEAQDLHDNPPF